MLGDLGYEVELAPEGQAAISRYADAWQSARSFDAVIMDLTVSGGMGGKEALPKLRAIDPQVKVIVSSGYNNDPVMANYRSHGFCGVLVKPYRLAELSQQVRPGFEELGFRPLRMLIAFVGECQTMTRRIFS